MKLTDLGQDILLEICGQVFEDNPRVRITLSWNGGSRDQAQPRIFPGAPAKILLDLASMHSELAVATRPYIWREVLVAFGSYDNTELGLGRLRRAQRPHIAPFVRAVFLSFDFSSGGSDAFLPLIETAIPLFTSLRAVCLGTFQTYSQPRMYENLARVIRAHPSIDTLYVAHMLQCADLIEQNSPRTYNISLDFCHDNSTAILLRPNAVRFVCLMNFEPQQLEKNWPADIWGTLEHLDPGYEDVAYYPPKNHQNMLSSLETYLAKGQRPALRSLTLSEVSPEKLKTWFKLLRGVDLEAFTCIRHGEQSFQVLEEILENFPKVRRLSVTLPGDETWEKDSDEIEEDEFDIDPDVVDLLSNFPNLQHLTLTVELSYDHISGLDVDLEEAAPELGQPVVGSLARWCLLLRNVQLIFKWEDMDVCAVSPIIVQYEIHRRRHEVSAEVVPPRLLDGTIFEFLQTR